MLTWQRIRVLRARPPARVRDERAAVFVAALEQSEQLMLAAADVGTAARPIPLFYSLSQAGRAIAAASLDDSWRLAGHGLTTTATEGTAGLLRCVVKPSRRKPAEGRRHSFAGVAEATGSASLSSDLELGAIWAAIPDLRLPLPQAPLDDRSWKRPLAVFRPMYDPAHRMLSDLRPLELLIDGLPPEEDTEALHRYLEDYPSAKGAYMVQTPGMPDGSVTRQLTPSGHSLPTFCWPDVPTNIFARAERLGEIAPDYRGLGTRLLFPLAGGKDALSPLMLWWAFLFGLSSVARYEPELWMAALEVNHSPLAVPIEAALDIALDAVPELILDVLVAAA